MSFSASEATKTLAVVLMHRILEEGGDGHDHSDHDHDGDEFADHDDHDDDDDSKPWGDVILASFLVQLVTFSGVLVTVLIGGYNRHRRRRHAGSGQDGDAAAAAEASIWSLLNNLIIPSFAAGALLATAVFLLLPESLELIQGGHGSHGDDAHDDGDQDDGHDHDHRHLASAAGATADVAGRLLRAAAAKRSMEEGGEGDGEAAVDTHQDEHEGHDDHNETAWKFGASLLGGFLLPILLGAIFPAVHPGDNDAEQPAVLCEDCELRKLRVVDEEEDVTATKKKLEDLNEGKDGLSDPISDEAETGIVGSNSGGVAVHEGGDAGGSADKPKEGGAVAVAVPVAVNWPLVGSIILGDAFHNFTDGIFLGNAFLLCSNDVAYTIVATTVYHEIAQEIADYALLIHHCGLAQIPALALNFCSGFSTMVGALLVLALDMSEMTMGVLLAISAGVYINIAASECIPRIQSSRRTKKDTLFFFLCFVVGCVPIGLVLLNHGHCEAEHDDHEDEGGDHDGHEH